MKAAAREEAMRDSVETPEATAQRLLAPRVPASEVLRRIDEPVDPEAKPSAPEGEELLYDAWAIIANAGGGNWTKETPDWQTAAVAWRERWHAHIAKPGDPVPAPQPEGARLKVIASQCLDALESDATLEQRRDAFDALRDFVFPAPEFAPQSVHAVPEKAETPPHHYVATGPTTARHDPRSCPACRLPAPTPRADEPPSEKEVSAAVQRLCSPPCAICGTDPNYPPSEPKAEPKEGR